MLEARLPRARGVPLGSDAEVVQVLARSHQAVADERDPLGSSLERAATVVNGARGLLQDRLLDVPDADQAGDASDQNEEADEADEEPEESSKDVHGDTRWREDKGARHA